jgi:hypothetical protein
VLPNPNARLPLLNALLCVGVHDLRVTGCTVINLTLSMGYRCEVAGTGIEIHRT